MQQVDIIVISREENFSREIPSGKSEDVNLAPIDLQNLSSLWVGGPPPAEVSNIVNVCDNGLDALMLSVRHSYHSIFVEGEFAEISIPELAKHLRFLQGDNSSLVIRVREEMSVDDRDFQNAMDRQTAIAVVRLQENLPPLIRNPIMDVKHFRHTFAGMEDVMLQATQEFLKQAPIIFELVHRATVQGQVADIELQAHTLKGMVSNFAAYRCTVSCFAVERAGKIADRERARKFLPSLQAELEDLVHFLKAGGI